MLIIGGGPAGSAAAIAAAREGLGVVLLERARAFRGKVGEALHPGVEPLLQGLGAAEALRAAGRLRFEGVQVAWSSPPELQPFGEDASGPWRGWQVDRDALDEALLAQAALAGAEVRRGVSARALLREGQSVVGVETDQGPLHARLLIDATGPARWLSRKARLPSGRRSPPLRVRYGYVRREVDDPNPSLQADEGGWTWIAPVGQDRVQWATLALAGERPAPTLAGERLDVPRGADVTWRLADAPAGPGWFLAGDAAVRLDPTSSHGVLRALTSGGFAGQTAAAILKRGAPAEEAAAAYARWLRRGAEADIAALAAQYARLGATGFG